PRATPLGVAFRKEPAAVLEQTLELARVFDRHAVSIASYLVGATATAASCFAQSGRDLIAGVAEALGPTFAGLGDAPGGDAVRGLERRITGLIPSVGITDGEEALAAVGGREPIDLLLAGLLLAAPVNDRF